MKPEWLILRSYFRQKWSLKVTLVIALLFFAAGALILSIEDDPGDADYALFFFSSATVFFAVFAAVHFKNLIGAPETSLTPGYMKRQFVALALFLTPATLLPAALMAFANEPFPMMFGLLFYLASFFFLIVYTVPQAGPIVQSFWFFIFAFNTFRFDSRPELLDSGDAFGFAAVAVSLLAFYTLGLRIKRERDEGVYALAETDYGLCGASDWQVGRAYRGNGRIGEWIIGKMMASAFRAHGLFRQVRLIQFGLAKPGFLHMGSNLALVALPVFVWLSTSLMTAGQVRPLGFERFTLNFWGFFFVVSAITLCADFLHRRDQLPALWMQAQTPSRRAFRKLVILGYLWVGAKQTAFYIAVMLVFALAAKATTATRALFVCFFGIAAFPAVLALSLIASPWMRSKSVFAWSFFGSLFSTILFLVTMLVSNLKQPIQSMTGFIPWLAGVCLLSALLMTLAWRRWPRLELHDAAAA